MVLFPLHLFPFISSLILFAFTYKSSLVKRFPVTTFSVGYITLFCQFSLPVGNQTMGILPSGQISFLSFYQTLIITSFCPLVEWDKRLLWEEEDPIRSHRTSEEKSQENRWIWMLYKYNSQKIDSAIVCCALGCEKLWCVINYQLRSGCYWIRISHEMLRFNLFVDCLSSIWLSSSHFLRGSSGQ